MRRKQMSENQPELIPHEHNPGQLDADGVGYCAECGEAVDTGEPIARATPSPRKRKAAPAEDCRHWALTLGVRAAVCNDCEKSFEIPQDSAKAATAARQEHNERVIGNMPRKEETL